MKSKKAQFFSFQLVIITIFMCFLAIGTYFLQAGSLKDSLVSPAKIMEIENDHEIFKIQEKDLLINSTLDLNWETSSSADVKEAFYDSLEKRPDLQKYIWDNIDNVGMSEDKEKEYETLKKFLKAEPIYSFTKTDDSITLTRSNLKKRFILRKNLN